MVMEQRPLADRQRYLEVLAYLLIADFQVTEEENAYLVEASERLQLSAADREAVLRRVDMAGDVSPIAAQIPADMADALLNDLEAAALCDGELAAREQAVIDAVRAALDR